MLVTKKITCLQSVILKWHDCRLRAEEANDLVSQKVVSFLILQSSSISSLHSLDSSSMNQSVRCTSGSVSQSLLLNKGYLTTKAIRQGTIHAMRLYIPQSHRPLPSRVAVLSGLLSGHVVPPHLSCQMFQNSKITKQ